MLTLQFVPYSDIENLNSEERIEKIMGIVKENKIILMQGRLNPEEETGLIKKTMGEIREEFSGIEICTIYPEERNLQFFNKIKKDMIRLILGNREGITIIGPATIIKDIRRDPNKILLYARLPRERNEGMERMRRKAQNGRTRSRSRAFKPVIKRKR